uniref:Chitinase-like protein (inferred by orthology to a C. elegans protein) n=1 Tax=Strongyloides venezuelensis TaxID=75913 RepID=A0A0K0FF66_STRVS
MPSNSFFCFTHPRNSISLKKEDFDELNCTHIAYGVMGIDNTMQIIPGNVNDDLVLSGYTNYQILNLVKRSKKNIKLFADVMYDSTTELLDYEFYRKKFIDNIIKLMKLWSFDGIFLRTDINALSSYSFMSFLDEFNVATDDASSKLNGKKIKIILRINGPMISQLKHHLLKLATKVDKLYITMPIPNLRSKDSKVEHIDPLYTSPQIPDYKALSKVISEANTLYNVPKTKIVVGLNIWSRGYLLTDDSLFYHGSSHKHEFKKSTYTGLYNGYYTLSEVCKDKNNEIDYSTYNSKSMNVYEGSNEEINMTNTTDPGDLTLITQYVKPKSVETSTVKITKREIEEKKSNTSLIYDVDSQTTAVFGNSGLYYQYVDPQHESFFNKLRWILNNGYGGVGLTNMEGDDSDDFCGYGKYPLHKAVTKIFQFSKHTPQIGNNECTRICKVSPSTTIGNIFENLQPSYCSHISIDDVTFTPIGDIKLSDESDKFIKDYENWDVDVKPYLMITVGQSMGSVQWRSLLLNYFYKEKFIKNLLKFMETYGIRHVNIVWTVEKFSSSFDGKTFSKFLLDFKKALGFNRYLFCNILPYNAYSNFYQIDEMVTAVDYFILEAHKFRDVWDKKTSHHSTLLIDSPLLEKRQMSADAFANDWIGRGVNPNMIIVEFSVGGQVVEMQTSAIRDTTIDNYIGLPVTPNGNNLRDGSKDNLSQDKICEIIQNNVTIQRFVEDMGVPYIVEGNNFISYDNEKSARMKSIWVSVKKFAGVSLKNIELDNIGGTCPVMNPYPILKIIASTQICNQCKSESSHDVAVLYDSKKEDEAMKVGENSTTNEESEVCDKINGKYRTVCVYRLPQKKDKFPLLPQKIPYSKCDEVLTEDVLLLPNASIIFRDEYSKSIATRLSRQIKKSKKVPVRTTITCFLPKNDFDTLLGDPQKLASKIVDHLIEYNLQGVELRCHGTLTPKMKKRYSEFVEVLRQTISLKLKTNSCTKILSLSLPSWAENVPQLYDVNVLNNLDYLSLDINNDIPSQSRANINEDKNENDIKMIEQTIQSWERAGIDTKKVLLNIPIYARSVPVDLNITRGLLTLSKSSRTVMVRRIEQKILCKELKKTGSVMRISYDHISGKSILLSNEEVTYETQDTLFYKLKYVMREKLGGILFNSLNDDDFSNECKQGMYSLLMSTKEALCQN